MPELRAAIERLVAGSPPPAASWPGNPYRAYNAALRRARALWRLVLLAMGASYLLGVAVAAVTGSPLAACALVTPTVVGAGYTIWLYRWRRRYFAAGLVLWQAAWIIRDQWTSLGIGEPPTTTEAATRALVALASFESSDTVTFLRLGLLRGGAGSLEEQQAALAAWVPSEPAAVVRKARMTAAVEFDRTGAADLSTAARLGAELSDPKERRAASVGLAAEAARQAALGGGNWTTPLRAAAQEIGPLPGPPRSRGVQLRGALLAIVVTAAYSFAFLGPTQFAGLFDVGAWGHELAGNGNRTNSVGYNDGFLAQQGRVLASPSDDTNAQAIALLVGALPRATPVGQELTTAQLDAIQRHEGVMFDWDGDFGFPSPPGFPGGVVQLDLLAGSYLTSGSCDVIVYLGAPGSFPRPAYRYSIDRATYARLVDLLLPEAPKGTSSATPGALVRAP